MLTCFVCVMAESYIYIYIYIYTYIYMYIYMYVYIYIYIYTYIYIYADIYIYSISKKSSKGLWFGQYNCMYKWVGLWVSDFCCSAHSVEGRELECVEERRVCELREGESCSSLQDTDRQASTTSSTTACSL